MNDTLIAAQNSGRLMAKVRWQPLWAMAQAVLWPSRWLAMAWILTMALILLGLFSQSTKVLLFLGVVLLLSLHLIIPIEINNLSRKKSWLLLPDFKSLVLKLLLLILLLWLTAFTLLNLASTTPLWLVLPYGALVFSMVMLPTIYVRHLWPLLAEIILLIAIGANTSVKSWLGEHGTAPWFTSLIVASTIAMWVWMMYRWLHPAQRDNNKVTRLSFFALCGIELQWLLRLTRSSKSLAGTLLLGDGDSRLASMMRALFATWIAPAAYAFTDLVFGGDNTLQALMLEKPSFVALFTLGPLFTLAILQMKASQRLARCWLIIGGPRQTMYGFAERMFYQELFAYQAMTAILIVLLLPLPMILPMLCYGTCATIFLSYLVFALAGRTLWWSIAATLTLLVALLVVMKFLWSSPDLIYLTSLALVLPVYSLRRSGKARWQKLDYSQLKPKQFA